MGQLHEKLISERERSTPTNLSIGTGLAIESLLGIGEFSDKKPSIDKIDSLWVNVRTIFRNLYNSMERQIRETLPGETLLNGLVEDILTLRAIIQNEGLGRVKIVFYHCSFKGLEKEFTKAYWKQLKTDKQKLEHKLEEDILNTLIAESDIFLNDVDFRQYNVKITGKDKRIYLLTHYPIDLLWRGNFYKVSLLESHSGAIKERSEWHTKLTGGKKYERIPFNRMTMQVFGDNNLLFANMGSKITGRILELAEKDKWNSVTTDEKVIYSINKIPYPVEKLFFLTLMRN